MAWDWFVQRLRRFGRDRTARIGGGLAVMFALVAVGLFVVATSGAVSNPTITSDKADYSPGATVTLTGSGWAPGEAVHIVVNDKAGQTWSYATDVTAEPSGGFTSQFQTASQTSDAADIAQSSQLVDNLRNMRL